MRRFAIVFLILGTLLLPVGVIGHWAYRTFTDTDRFVATVAPLTESPAVQQGIADTITESLITPEGAAAQVEEWFPKAPDGLVQTVSVAVVNSVNSIVGELVATEQFSQLWATANADAQKAAIAVLSNEPPPSLSVQDGNLVLNLDVVAQTVKQRAQERGINLPDLGLDAPTVVLMEDTQIQQARSVYSWAAPLLQWFWILPVALLVAYVAITKNVRRMGIGVLISSGILALFLMTGQAALSPSFQGTAFEAAQPYIWNTLTAFLAQATWITFGVAVGLIILGFFVGPKKPEPAVVVDSVVVAEPAEK
jgi:hypothetical protein